MNLSSVLVSTCIFVKTYVEIAYGYMIWLSKKLNLSECRRSRVAYFAWCNAMGTIRKTNSNKKTLSELGE